MTKSPRGQRMRFSARRLVSLLLIISIMAISTGNILWPPTKAAVPSTLNISEWQIPSGNVGPAGINVDSTGRVWFAENLTGKLGMLDPAANNIYEWNLPNGPTQASVNSRNMFATGSVTYGVGSFRTYFAEYGKDRISYLDTTAPTPTAVTTTTSLTTTITSTTTTPLTNTFNRLTEWQLPSGSKPASIFVDDHENIWFTESGRDAIGELNTVSLPAQFIEWDLPGANPGAGKCAALCLWGIYVQKIPNTSDYYVWFTERTGGQTDAGEVGRLQLSNNVLTTWDLGTIGKGLPYQPFDISVDPTGNAYFSNYFGNTISILGNGGTYREYAIGTTNSEPVAVTPDPARNLSWFLEKIGNNLGYVNNTAPGNILTLSASQCIIPSTITVTTTITNSLISYTTTTNTNSVLQSCGGNAFENGEVSVTPIQPSGTGSNIGAPNVSNENPSIHPLGNAQGPVNGISEYAFQNSKSGPYSLTLDSNNDLWMTESDTSANKIAEVILPSGFNIQVTSPSELSIAQGGVAQYSFSVNPVSGSQSQVFVSVNPPSGLTANFNLNPSSGTPPFQSTLTITTKASTPPSTYVITITGTSNTDSHSLNIVLIVLLPSSVTTTATSTATPEFLTPLPVLAIALLFITLGAKSRRKLRGYRHTHE